MSSFVFLALASGCSFSDAPTESLPTEAVASDALLDATWVALAATEADILPYAHPGWVAILMDRDYASAVVKLGPGAGESGRLPTARAHADLAALYRQAALVAAYGLIEVYGKTPQPTDPLGVNHLLTVSYVITGQRALAVEAMGKPVDEVVEPWRAPWKAWLSRETPWPPDFSSLPLNLPPVTVGLSPDIVGLPHYALPEREGSNASRNMADPGALVALALWHDAAAALAAPGSEAQLKSLHAPYRLPVEPAPAAAGPLPAEFVFGSDLLVPGDGPFFADLEGPLGLDAIEAHAETSLLAAIALRVRAEGKFDAESAVDSAISLRSELVDRGVKRAGTELRHHRTFADVAQVAVLRGLALVAEREGDREASGLLRIHAYEHHQKAAACPIGLLAFAAWDASNRSPMRAQDIVHAQARRYPSIEIARYGLDVLALRVGLERTGETAGM